MIEAARKMADEAEKKLKEVPEFVSERAANEYLREHDELTITIPAELANLINETQEHRGGPPRDGVDYPEIGEMPQDPEGTYDSSDDVEVEGVNDAEF